jgi:hypothetical protein
MLSAGFKMSGRDETAAHANRAGRYVTQATGSALTAYRAFVPARLPTDPPVRIEGELQSLLSQADRALGRLDGSIQTLPHADLFVYMYVRKEAVLSSQIEGTQVRDARHPGYRGSRAAAL